MATRSKRPARPCRDEEIARLRRENARLRAQVRALKAAAHKGEAPMNEAVPPLPAPDADGNYPAEETLGAILAQQVVRRRRQAGWTQAELAEQAGVRQETVSRIESGKNTPNVATVDRIDRALKGAGV